MCGLRVRERIVQFGRRFRRMFAAVQVPDLARPVLQIDRSKRRIGIDRARQQRLQVVVRLDPLIQPGDDRMRQLII